MDEQQRVGNADFARLSPAPVESVDIGWDFQSNIDSLTQQVENLQKIEMPEGNVEPLQSFLIALQKFQREYIPQQSNNKEAIAPQLKDEMFAISNLFLRIRNKMADLYPEGDAARVRIVDVINLVHVNLMDRIAHAGSDTSSKK